MDYLQTLGFVWQTLGLFGKSWNMFDFFESWSTSFESSLIKFINLIFCIKPLQFNGSELINQILIILIILISSTPLLQFQSNPQKPIVTYLKSTYSLNAIKWLSNMSESSLTSNLTMSLSHECLWNPRKNKRNPVDALLLNQITYIHSV